MAALGDHAWLDVNLDRIQDEPRDQGMNGVIVKLLDGNGDPVVDAIGSLLTCIAVGHSLTSAPGWYEFAGLPARNYRVQFVAAGYSFTTPYQGGGKTADSNANPSTGTTGVVRLAPGQVNPTIDAGLVGTGPASVRLASFSGRSSALPLRGFALAAAGGLVWLLRQASER